MSAPVAVIIPWRDGCPHRERALHWVLDRYAARHPSWDVTIAPAPEGPWRKGAAIASALRTARADLVVVADADCWCGELDKAIQALRGGQPWAIPHQQVNRLTARATRALLDGQCVAGLEQPAYRGIEGGGFVISHRETLATIPMDPRFTGWGQEDESWSSALNCLLGPPWRGTADLIHLYHPAQVRLSRRRGSVEGWQLRRRYHVARRDPVLMRALLEEAHDALQPVVSPVPDRAPHPVR